MWCDSRDLEGFPQFVWRRPMDPRCTGFDRRVDARHSTGCPECRQCASEMRQSDSGSQGAPQTQRDAFTDENQPNVTLMYHLLVGRAITLLPRARPVMRERGVCRISSRACGKRRIYLWRTTRVCSAEHCLAPSVCMACTLKYQVMQDCHCETICDCFQPTLLRTGP